MSSKYIQSTCITGEYTKLIDDFLSNKKECSINELVIFFQRNFTIDVTTDQDIISGYNHDWSNLEGRAEALFRPKNSIECALIMKICYYLDIKMTLSAGRTNLTGSATPEGGIIISINNLKEIERLDMSSKTITVSPGTYIEELRQVVNNESKNQLEFSVDPTSRREAMIGGAISCNASGFIPGDKGAIRYWVNGLDIVLPNGEFLRIKRGQYISENGQFDLIMSDGTSTVIKIPSYKRVNLKNASGPFSSSDGIMDLIDLFIGSEGIFGCITKALLSLDVKPKNYLNLFIKFKNESEAFDFNSYIRKYLNNNMSDLKAFEYFGENCFDFMDDRDYLFDEIYNVGIYIQIPIFEDNKDMVISEWHNTLMNFDYIINDNQILSLDDPISWKKFFRARHSIPANALQKSKEYRTSSIITDTIVPPDKFEEFIRKTHSLIVENSIDYLLFGHLGDCHLHFHIIPNKKNEKDAIKCYKEIIRTSSDLGGVYSAEHGTGKRKRNDFIECYGQIAVDEIKECKTAFDPKFLLNRGNVINY